MQELDVNQKKNSINFNKSMNSSFTQEEFVLKNKNEIKKVEFLRECVQKIKQESHKHPCL